MNILKGIITSVVFFTILITGTVNLAVEHRFSWFYIVLASVLFVYGIVYTLVFNKGKRIRSALIFTSVSILPVLEVIQLVVNSFYSKRHTDWFYSIALPITMCWILILWSIFSLFKYSKIRKMYCVIMCIILTFVGSAITSLVVIDNVTDSVTGLSYIEFVASVIIALVLTIVCIIKPKR